MFPVSCLGQSRTFAYSKVQYQTVLSNHINWGENNMKMDSRPETKSNQVQIAQAVRQYISYTYSFNFQSTYFMDEKTEA